MTKVYKGSVIRDNEGGVGPFKNGAKHVGDLKKGENLDKFITRHYEEKGKTPPKHVTTPESSYHNYPHEARTVGDTMYIHEAAEKARMAGKGSSDPTYKDQNKDRG